MSHLNFIPNGSHEEYGWLAARTSGHYFSGRLCHNDSALLLWLQWQTYCPTGRCEVLMCTASTERTILKDPRGLESFSGKSIIRTYLRSPPKTGRWTADLYQKNLRSHSGGETRLRIEAVRDLTELNWTDHLGCDRSFPLELAERNFDLGRRCKLLQEADLIDTEWFMIVMNWCIRIFFMSYHRN